jgi:tetratricopeptide (TPR) repeat protein
MKRIFFYTMALAALVLMPSARAATLDDAHAAFAAGKYQESTADYQSVVDRQGYSAPVLFDLGNSCYRHGNYPEAILAYKRALWLAPNDEDIKANLEAAQRQAGAAIQPAPAYTKFIDLLSVNGWAWTGCAAWTLLCACMLLRAFLPAQRALFSTGGFVCALVLLSAIGAVILSLGGLREAVVVDKSATALISPFPAAQSVFTPVPGETVRIEKAYNDYLLIADNAGRTGWMAKSQIEPVVR